MSDRLALIMALGPVIERLRTLGDSRGADTVEQAAEQLMELHSLAKKAEQRKADDRKRKRGNSADSAESVESKESAVSVESTESADAVVVISSISKEDLVLEQRSIPTALQEQRSLLGESEAPSPKKKAPSGSDDSLFVTAWEAYPANPRSVRSTTYDQWKARVKQGIDPGSMVDGARRFAAYCKATDKDPEFIMAAQRFFGRERHFEAAWEIPGTAPPTALTGPEIIDGWMSPELEAATRPAGLKASPY